jgi:MazG family protein
VAQRDALGELDALTRRLRRECPWDREQDERSIVPHTVEEAYELADAVQGGDDSRMLDELGDVLFQVVFLSLLLEERGAGDLAAVADHCARKLVRRHPHVFGEARARSAGEVLRNWDAIKRSEPGRDGGTFADLPHGLPALTLTRKVRRRAAAAGFELPDPEASRAELVAQLEGLDRASDRDERFHAVGDLLFAAAALAQELSVDGELALRAACQRFYEGVET